jgi:ribonuclease PH
VANNMFCPCLGVTAALVNCASLALAHGSLEMRGLCTAVGVVLSEDGSLVLDPSLEEERLAAGSCTLSYDTSRDRVAAISMNGAWTAPQGT